MRFPIDLSPSIHLASSRCIGTVIVLLWKNARSAELTLNPNGPIYESEKDNEKDIWEERVYIASLTSRQTLLRG